VRGICKITAGEIIAFDGKQSRNSGDEKNGEWVINTILYLSLVSVAVHLTSSKHTTYLHRKPNYASVSDHYGNQSFCPMNGLV
jgi:hypothetical protein